jgi:hypothetical protein
VNEKDQISGDYIFAGQLPEIGVPYWVQCKKFTCKAVVDKEGNWKAFTSGRELTDVIFGGATPYTNIFSSSQMFFRLNPN